MNIIVSTDAGTVYLNVAGELDMDTADDLHKPLHQAVTRPGTTTIVIDFAQVSFCDSSGIAVLDRAYGEARDAGITLRLVNPQPTVRRVLSLLRMLQTLTGAD
ncbi:Anti-sigma F factor antagonist [Actinoplanes sp. SE50]|uniref:STAS domain-containing protein n=1 Tax=unclassified Actinoplanes TaxID=2626549 RepID=UPI00023ED2EA|nr:MULTISPECIES: STAS domain-containing protein [unclassified Actinoplanes]AEV86725.1 Anti-sigma F factor antagonist [Actinoplanes sp. SE50/110]ATO85123.1 Anti-sigma F factor antagonist [Actinoplanes sp. SE50]SLM02534.1 anti-sigma F factor antagonist [Actinoplanes sp. SE50/110]